MTQRLGFLAGASVALALFATGCADTPPEKSAKEERAIPPPVPESNGRMAKRLRQIADHVTVENSVYRNDERVEIMGRQIAERNRPPGLQSQMRLAVQLMRSGRPEEAIEQVDRVTEMLKTDEQN